MVCLADLQAIAPSPKGRVSGVMTNAPFMLNVDCDMFVNNPEVVQHGMCLLFGFDRDQKSGFVKTPQHFYGGIRDDPFGNQLVVMQHYAGMGSNGLGCPTYSGTGCFHRRKVIYGEAPELEGEETVRGAKGTPSPQELHRRFGSSREMQESTAWIISARGSTSDTTPAMVKGLTVKQEAANQVASCTYEVGTCWGREVSEPAFAIPALLSVSYSVYTLAEYLACGLSVRAWWNNQRMQRVQWTSPSLFGLLSVVAKVLGLSETTFELTPKDQNASSYARLEAATLQNLGRFTFDSSTMFVPGTALVFLNSAAAAAILLKLLGSPAGIAQYGDVVGPGIAELACSLWVVMSFWPFVRGLFGKGSYGLPWSTILKGSVLSSLFFVFCKWSF